MKISILVKYMRGEIDIASLLAHDEDDLKEFEARLKLKGASVPISIDDDLNHQYSIEKGDILRLCRDYLDGHLDQVELSFYLTVVEMCETFSIDSEELEDCINYLSDIDSEYPLTSEQVKAIVESLLGK